jgi:hypothetical protein
MKNNGDKTWEAELKMEELEVITDKFTQLLTQ